VTDQSNATTDQQRRHVVLVLDRSGSMHSARADTEGGVASLLAEQVEALRQHGGETRVTLAQFDHQYELVHDRTPLTEHVRWELHARGRTALYDAIGRTVASVRQADAELRDAERPTHTALVIVTDGMENASTEWGRTAVRDLIGEVRAAGWEVIFLAADLDAWSVSDGLGIDRANAASYSKSQAGTRAAYTSAGGMVANSTTGGPRRGFSERDREAMLDGQPETD
jgi:Mg-chelatase subunit ChlD